MKSGEKSMVQNSLNSQSSDAVQLQAQVRECYGRVVYSHKTQEKCCDILLDRLSTLKLTQVVLSAITTGGFIVTIIGENKWGAIVGVVVSTLLLVINAYTKNHDLGEIAQKHKQAANDMWLIREKYLSLLTDISIGTKSQEDLIAERDDLMNALHKIYIGAPATNSKAYEGARQALQNEEELTFTEQEIDQLLPEKLRLN